MLYGSYDKKEEKSSLPVDAGSLNSQRSVLEMLRSSIKNQI